MNIAILGGGSWGTALAIHLEQKHSVKIWEFIEEQAKTMQEKRVCPIFPDAIIPGSIFISSNMKEILKDSELALIVVPSDKVEMTIRTASEYLSDQDIVICSKGFGSKQKLLSDVVKPYVRGGIFCLYGPTLAKEVAKHDLSGMVLAGKGDKSKLKLAIETINMRVETTDDIIGVQIGAALKNVVTIFVGIIEGLGLGDNTKAYVFTKGIKEIKDIGVALGAQPETFFGLTCMGDLILNSRNRQLGIEIGRGKLLRDLLADSQHINEGIICIENAIKLKDKLNIETPLISGLYDILFNGESVDHVLSQV